MVKGGVELIELSGACLVIRLKGLLKGRGVDGGKGTTGLMHWMYRVEYPLRKNPDRKQ